MKLGLFMMPLHDPGRDYMDVLTEDREVILLDVRRGPRRVLDRLVRCAAGDAQGLG